MSLGRERDRESAEAVRNRSLTPGEAHGLANLLEGTHPQGLRLKMTGQGKGWWPIVEGYKAFQRAKAIGAFVEERLKSREPWEGAVIDAAEQFGVYEATVSRDVRIFRLMNEEGEA